MLPRQPARLIAGQEDCDLGDVFRLADAAQRRLGFDTLLEIAADEAGGMGAFAFHHAWIDGIDADLARAQFRGHHQGDGIQRAFGPGKMAEPGMPLLLTMEEMLITLPPSGPNKGSASRVASSGPSTLMPNWR